MQGGPSMSTIRDVAKRANVGIATVSRVLNDKPGVDPDTKKKIEDAIKELSYIPNEVARTLYTRKSKTIGVIVPNISSNYVSGILEVFEDEAMNNNYHLMVCNSKNNKEREAKYLKVFQQNNIAGIILISNTTRIQDYIKLGIPLITLDHKPYEGIASVSSNNIMGAELAAQKLVSTKCKKILHFQGPSALHTVQNRAKGFDSVLKKAKLKAFNLELTFKNPSLNEIENFLQLHPDADGIFCDSDLIAIYVIQVLRKHGRKIPDDVQVIGFDNIELGSIIYPALSTIAQSADDIGKYTISTLIDLINRKEIDSFHHLIDISLIERDTTK